MQRPSTVLVLALSLTVPACLDLDEPDTALSDDDVDLSETEQSLQLPRYTLVDSVVSSPGTDALVRASCPSSTVVLGASWRATDAAGTTIDTVVGSASGMGGGPPGTPSGTTWLLLAHSLTGTPYTIRLRLVCAAAAGFQYVTETTRQGSGSSAVAIATCPDGKRVTGGGHVLGDSANRMLAGEPTASLPSQDGTRWIVAATAPRGTQNWTLTTYALCADLAALPGYQILSARTPLAGGTQQLVTTCPKPSGMLGAGWNVRTASNAIGAGRATLHDVDASGRSVETRAQPQSPSKWSLEQHAICVN